MEKLSIGRGDVFVLKSWFAESQGTYDFGKQSSLAEEFLLLGFQELTFEIWKRTSKNIEP